MSIRIHFHDDIRHSQKIQLEFNALVERLREEFPEAKKFEISFNRSGDLYDTHVHITGKELSVAARAKSRVMHDALVDGLDRAHRQLRKHHDKQIFGHRREAMRNSHLIS